MISEMTIFKNNVFSLYSTFIYVSSFVNFIFEESQL